MVYWNYFKKGLPSVRQNISYVHEKEIFYDRTKLLAAKKKVLSEKILIVRGRKIWGKEDVF